MTSRSLMQAIRLSRRMMCTRTRDVTCFISGVLFTSIVVIILYTVTMYNANDPMVSRSLSDTVTTLPPIIPSAVTDLLSEQTELKSINSVYRGAERGSTTSTNSTLSINLPIIYIITPTHTRITQKVDLTRLCQTLSLVKNVVWIIVEDSNERTSLVTDLVSKCPVTSVHLAAITTSFVPRSEGGGGHRGVEQRNAGLTWIRHNVASDTKGVVYFGDDDNGYDIRLFEEMRYTKVVSVWPVAFVGNLRYEAPVCANGKVVGWHVSFRPDRKFPMDMAAFAVNLSLILLKSNLYINPKSKPGMLENNFLVKLGISRKDLEPRADNCRSILVWHVKTSKPSMPSEHKKPGDKNIVT